MKSHMEKIRDFPVRRKGTESGGGGGVSNATTNVFCNLCFLPQTPADCHPLSKYFEIIVARKPPSSLYFQLPANIATSVAVKPLEARREARNRFFFTAPRRKQPQGHLD